MLTQPLHRLLRAVVIASTSFAVAVPACAGDHDTPIAQLTEHDGVWRSRGYGWVWLVQDGQIQAYEESGSYCIKNEDGIDKYTGGPRFSTDGRSFRISFDDPAYEYVFDRIDGLPDACRDEHGDGPVAVVDAMEKIFSAHYAFFRQRKIDWPAIVRAAREKVTGDTSNEELLEILREMISKFDDDHVSLHARIDGERVVVNTGQGKVLRPVAVEARAQGADFNSMVERWKAMIWTNEALASLLGDTAHTAANGKVKYGLIDGDIGLLIVESMDEFATDDDQGDAASLDEALDGAMALFQGAKAVIVDVSANDGGSDTFARQIASRFAHRRTLAYSRYAGDVPRSRAQRIYIAPSERPRYAGPAYVLTSNVSVSSAETFTMAMRALPHVTHVGQRTRGAFSELSRMLPNGWYVVLSNEIFLDADGKPWEGIGIPPQIPMQVFPEDGRKASPLAAVRALASCIRRGKCMRSQRTSLRPARVSPPL